MGTKYQTRGLAAAACDVDVSADGSALPVNSILDALPVFVAVLAADGAVVQTNAAAWGAGRLRPDEVLGMHVADTSWWSHSPESQAAVRSAVDAARRGRGSRFEAAMCVGQERLVPVDVSVAPGTREYPEFIVVTAADISDRKRLEAERDSVAAKARRAEEESQAERQRYNQLMMDAPAMIAYLSGPEHVIEFVNPEFAEVVGRPREQMLGRPFRQCLTEYHQSGLIELLDQVYATGETFVGREVPVPLVLNGQPVDAYRTMLYLPSRNAAGAIDGILVHASDVTEHVRARRRVEELAREADQERARLKAVIEHLPIGILFAEAPSGRIVLGNHKAEEILGHPVLFSADAVRSEEWTAYHPDGRTVGRDEWPLARALRGQVVSGEEYVYERGDGTRTWILAGAAPILGPDGSITGSVAAFHDIGPHKREERARRDAEHALAQSERRFRLIADTMPQLVWTTAPDGYHEYFNRRWYEYTGTAENDTLGEGWLRLLHPDDRTRTAEHWRNCLKTGQPYQIEYRFRGADGMYRWFLGRALPVRDADGRILRWFGTCTDIQDQKESEAALRRSNDDLEQFAYAASHDLQEPLRMVAIYAQLLQRRYATRLDGDADMYIEQVVTGAQRMETLLHDLRAYIHATRAAELRPERPRCEAAQCYGRVLVKLSAPIDESAAVVRAGPLPEIAVQAVHLEQVLQNLISNALKYRSDSAPRVEIAAQRADDQWLFSVTDNGIGIDPQYAKQVFGVFKRLHGQKYPGTGIGLPICQRIVESYGGAIWVKSEPGRGSTFFFTLPAVEEKVR